MHFHLVDSYIDTDSGLHRMDPRIKVAMVIIIVLIISLMPMGMFGAYTAVFILVMIGTLFARVDPMLVFKRSLIALPFAGAAITLVFTIPGPAIGTVPLTGWEISEPGLVRFASIVFKSMLSVQAAVLLMLSTHFTDMLWALGALRVPRVVVAIISFMYRYIFVLAEEAMRLTRARDSRSAVINDQVHRGRVWLFRIRTTGRMIGNLFVRSFARSERVYQAMVARGYKGEMLRLSPPDFNVRDILIAAVPITYCIVILFLTTLF